MPIYTDQIKRPSEEHEYTIEQIRDVKKCKEDIFHFLTFIKIVHPDRGRVIFDPYEYQKKLFELLVKERFVACLMARQMGKDVDVNTPIPTPDGWSTVKDLSVGDVIFGRDGKQCNIIKKSPIYKDRKAYKFIFDTGEEIVSSYTHEWNINHSYWRGKEKTLTTQQIVDLYNRYRSKSFYIKLSESLDLPEIDLPIDPYTLGVWLGDGSSWSGEVYGSTDDLIEIMENVVYEKLPIRNRENHSIQTIKGMYNKTHNLYRNKHIPSIYLRSSTEQRLQLLRGLMDTDGSVEKSGRCEFYQKEDVLIDQVRELLSSLGVKTNKRCKIIEGVKYYTLSFCTSKYRVFNLKRKYDRQQNLKDHPKNYRLYIKDIQEVEPRETQCITVDNDDHLFLCGKQMIPTHNSLSVGAYALWYSLFNADKVVGIVSNKESSAIDFLSRIKIMYEELPVWLKCGVVEYNKKTIIFENGTVIVAGATSKNAFRGKTANIIISDELAFVEGDKAEDFYMSNYPTISVSKYGKFIAISTPNGIGGLFYELYKGAEKNRNEYKPYRVDWREHPERDKEWARIQLRNIGQRRFDQEYEIEFLGSSNTVIDKDTLVRLVNQDLPDVISRSSHDKLKVYERPVDNCIYILGTDPSKGTGEHDATIQVLKVLSVNPFKLKQVAVFQDNKTDTYEFAHILDNLSVLYNNAFIMCENNGEGSAVIQTLWWDIETENLVCEGTKASKLGVRATTKTKPIAVLLMKRLIEDMSVELVDHETIKQLTAFIDKGNNRFAGDGLPDDLVSALYWGTYFMKFDLLDESMSLKEVDRDDDIWSIFSDSLDDVEDGYEVLYK